MVNAQNVLHQKSYIFQDITLCSPVKVRRRFGGKYRLHFKGARVRQARNQREGKKILQRLVASNN
jgi:hypothetical protein